VTVADIFPKHTARFHVVMY